MNIGDMFHAKLNDGTEVDITITQAPKESEQKIPRGTIVLVRDNLASKPIMRKYIEFKDGKHWVESLVSNGPNTWWLYAEPHAVRALKWDDLSGEQRDRITEVFFDSAYSIEQTYDEFIRLATSGHDYLVIE